MARERIEVKSRVLNLVFSTNLGTTIKVVVNNPHTSLQPAAIKAGMEAMVASEVLGDYTGTTKATGIKEAYYTVVQTDELDLTV